MELRVICAIGEYWPTARSHSASSEPATKVRNSGVKMGSHEWSKSETSRFTNFETALSLLPSLSKRQEVVPKLSWTLLVKSPRCRTAVCKLHVCLTLRRLAWAAHCLQALLSLFAPSFVTERVHKVWKRSVVHCHGSWFPRFINGRPVVQYVLDLPRRVNVGHVWRCPAWRTWNLTTLPTVNL